MSPVAGRRPISARTQIVLVLALAAIALIALPLAGAARQGTSDEQLDQLLEGVAKHLELTDEQRGEVDEPLRELFRLLPEVQRLHVKVALDLNEKQRTALANIVTAHVATGGAHGNPHAAH